VIGGHRIGSVVGFITYGGDMSAMIAVTNLNYLRVTVEVNCLDGYTTNPCVVPGPRLTFRRAVFGTYVSRAQTYSSAIAWNWELPSFSDPLDGRHPVNGPPTWHLPLCLARPTGNSPGIGKRAADLLELQHPRLVDRWLRL